MAESSSNLRQCDWFNIHTCILEKYNYGCNFSRISQVCLATNSWVPFQLGVWTFPAPHIHWLLNQLKNRLIQELAFGNDEDCYVKFPKEQSWGARVIRRLTLKSSFQFSLNDHIPMPLNCVNNETLECCLCFEHMVQYQRDMCVFVTMLNSEPCHIPPLEGSSSITKSDQPPWIKGYANPILKQSW